MEHETSDVAPSGWDTVQTALRYAVDIAGAATGGCPISRAAYKRDIRYLEQGELERYRRELLGMKLATWRYKHDPARERLGFIIDDNEISVAVANSGEHVDLYGYTSLAVATLQMQSREIQALKAQVTALEAKLSGRSKTVRVSSK